MSDIIANTIFGVSVVVALWALVCNYRAYRQRLEILDEIRSKAQAAIRAGTDWIHLFDGFSCVSYESHLFRLFTFRSPDSLYPSSFDTSSALEGDLTQWLRETNGGVGE